MLTFPSAFISGGLEPFWPHFWLLSVSVLASLGVGAGIVLEQPQYSPSVHRAATWLVIVGVIIEATCTIFLFVFDEGISSAQQSKIIALELRLAPRKIGNPASMIEKLKPFSGTPFDIGIQPDSEAFGMLDQLLPILQGAGWIWKPASGPVVVNVPGKPALREIVLPDTIEILFPKNRLSDWGIAAGALAGALRFENIPVIARPDDDDPATAIHISIGTKD